VKTRDNTTTRAAGRVFLGLSKSSGNGFTFVFIAILQNIQSDMQTCVYLQYLVFNLHSGTPSNSKLVFPFCFWLKNTRDKNVSAYKNAASRFP